MDAPPSSTWGISKVVSYCLADRVQRVNIANVNVLQLIVGICLFAQRITVYGCGVLEPAAFNVAVYGHPVTSPNNRKISSSASFNSVSISSSGRGGVYL